MQLGVPERNAALGPVEIVVNAKFDRRFLANAVYADGTTEARILRWQAAGPQRGDDAVGDGERGR